MPTEFGQFANICLTQPIKRTPDKDDAINDGLHWSIRYRKHMEACNAQNSKWRLLSNGHKTKVENMEADNG